MTPGANRAAMNVVKMKTSAASATTLLKGLANQHRLIILCHLADGERSVGELEALLGMRQPHLSQHLARLRRDALVATRRDSRTIYYRLGSTAAARVIRTLYELYCAPAGKRAGGRTSPSNGQDRNGRPRRAAAAAARGERRR
jgi:DNA-binding transcriptional ArsR family regulator